MPRTRAVVAVCSVGAAFALLAMLHTRTPSPPQPRDPVWTIEVDVSPIFVAIVGDMVLSQDHLSLTAYSLDSGSRVWSKPIAWPNEPQAMDGPNIIITDDFDVGTMAGQTGLVEFFANDVVDLRVFLDSVFGWTCDEQRTCVLSNWAPGGRMVWETRSLVLDQKLGSLAIGPLPESVRLAGTYVGAPVFVSSRRMRLVPSGLRTTPRLVSIHIGPNLEIIDTQTGRQVGQAYPESPWLRTFLVGMNVIRVTTTSDGEHCVYSVTSYDLNGAIIWRRDDLDMATVTGAACQQSGDLVAVDDAIWARRGSQEVVVSSTDGREVWIGEPRARLIAMGSKEAIIRSGDQVRLYMVDLGSGEDSCSMYEPSTTLKDVALLSNGFVVADANDQVKWCGSRQLTAISDRTDYDEAVLLGSGSIRAVGEDGVIILRDKNLSYVRYRFT